MLFSNVCCGWKSFIYFLNIICSIDQITPLRFTKKPHLKKQQLFKQFANYRFHANAAQTVVQFGSHINQKTTQTHRYIYGLSSYVQNTLIPLYICMYVKRNLPFYKIFAVALIVAGLTTNKQKWNQKTMFVFLYHFEFLIFLLVCFHFVRLQWWLLPVLCMLVFGCKCVAALAKMVVAFAKARLKPTCKTIGRIKTTQLSD